LGELPLFALQRLANARLRDERAFRQVLAPARHGEFGATLPFRLLAPERVHPALQLSALGDGPNRRRSHLDQCVLHLLHDKPDDLFRVLGAVEDGLDVGIHDVGKPRENAHGVRSS
jgi:hypothetical protein